MACYDEALRYAGNRVMFDRPIGQTQIQQVRLADMLTEITKAQLLTLQLGRLKDAGTMTPAQASLRQPCCCAGLACQKLCGSRESCIQWTSTGMEQCLRML
jgi:alkylation response protein AidB-like acyl-CoA dehydrogenase